MQSASAKWNDDRLYALKADIDRQFEQVDRRFEQVDRRFEQVDRRFVSLEGEMREGFKEVRMQIAQLNSNLLRMSILYGGSVLALFGAVLLRG